MSQRQQILRHLRKHKSLTSLEALYLCQCWRLSGRILELREAGVPIKTTMVRTATGKRVARYSL